MASGKEKKHQAFVDEYFLCGMNQTEAYMRVYPKSSYDAARANAARLIADDSIQEEITRRLKEKQLSADEVLARLGDMARSNIADFSGVRHGSDLKDIYDKTHVVKKFKRRVNRTAYGSEVETVELELYDAQSALEKIGKHHGLFTDKIEVKLAKELDTILATIEGVLDADSYQRVLQAIISSSEGGSEETQSDSDS